MLSDFKQFIVTIIYCTMCMKRNYKYNTRINKYLKFIIRFEYESFIVENIKNNLHVKQISLKCTLLGTIIRVPMPSGAACSLVK